jgi:uncharacterized phage infection (PIP) family protein YhgE
MNANKLADGLDKIWDNECRSPIVSKSADMLRQQQAEIEALKKFIAEGNALDKKLHESIQKANEVWGKATKSILKKAKE